MKKLLVHMRPYWKESALGPLFKLLEAGFELLVPFIVAFVIDHGIAQKDGGYVARMVVYLLLLAIVGMGCAIVAQYFAAKASVGFVGNIRRALLNHIQGFSFAKLDAMDPSTLMTRMTSDINQIQTGVNLLLRLLLRSPFVVFGAMIMAFTIDKKAALVFVAVIPLLFVVILFVMIRCIPLYRTVQSKLDGVFRLTKENLSGVRVIRAFGHEQNEISEFEQRTAQLAKTQFDAGRFSSLMNPLTYVIIHCAIIALIWIGAIRVQAGSLTQGAVVALYHYMSQILVELVKLANLLITLSRAIACGNRVSALFDIERSGRADNGNVLQPTGETAVDFQNVTFGYPGAQEPFLQNIQFTAKRGETIGIIGGTGSGKSTLVNLIPRCYDATEGVVLVNGVDVKRYPVDTLRCMIGVVPQQAVLFQGSIRENMLWGREDASDEQIMQALELAQAKTMVLEKEGGLDHHVEQGGRNLSGGQRQRLTIARALLRSPDILILDDSASALDYATDAALRKAIQSLRDMTVLIVSQRASSVRYADRIVVLDDGKMVGYGTSEQLLQSCPIYREIYETQFQKEVSGA